MHPPRCFLIPRAGLSTDRARAEEVRKRAASIRSATARSKFLEIAETYDRLAWQVETMGDEPEAARGRRKAAE